MNRSECDAWIRCYARELVHGGEAGGFCTSRSSTSANSGAGKSGADEAERAVKCGLRGYGSRVDRAGEALAGAAAAGVLFGAQRTYADGADALQPAVSLVRGCGDRRHGVGPLGVLEESRPAAGE